MLDLPQRADLPREAGLCFGVSRPDQALQRHLPAQRGLPGAVNYSHASLPQLAKHFELADDASRGRASLCRRAFLGLGATLPLGDLFAVHRHTQDAREQLAPVFTQVQPLMDLARTVAKIRAVLPLPRGMKKQYLFIVRRIDHERVKGRSALRLPCLARSLLQVNATGAGDVALFGAGQFQRLDGPERFTGEFLTLDQPVSRRLKMHIQDVDQAAAGKNVKLAEQFRDARQQRLSQTIAELVRTLARCALFQFLVAAADQAVKQIGQARRVVRFAFVVQRLAQERVEFGDARHVVSNAPEQQVLDRDKPRIARIRKHRRQQMRELPPVAQGRPHQVAETLGEARIMSGPFGVGRHRDGTQQLQRRFPEEIGRLMTIQRRLGIACTAIELRQRQGQTAQQILVAGAPFSAPGMGGWSNRGSRSGLIRSLRP